MFRISEILMLLICFLVVLVVDMVSELMLVRFINCVFIEVLVVVVIDLYLSFLFMVILFR